MIWRCLRLAAAVILLLTLGEWAQGGAKLQPESVQGFEQFVRDLEANLEKRTSGEVPFFRFDEDPAHWPALKGGRILIDEPKNLPEIPGAKIHVWLGAVFVPGAGSGDVLSVLKDFDRHQEWYPEVLESRVLSREGDRVRGYQRLKMQKILTVIFNTEHEVVYSQVSPKRWRGVSYSTRIAEVKDAGKPKERELPVGEDRGFMWRLNAYWHLEEREGGVLAECWAVSLSRKLPFALRWMLKPLVSTVPQQALRNTLRGTRQAVLDRLGQGARSEKSGRVRARKPADGKIRSAGMVAAADIMPVVRWFSGDGGSALRSTRE